MIFTLLQWYLLFVITYHPPPLAEPASHRLKMESLSSRFVSAIAFLLFFQHNSLTHLQRIESRHWNRLPSENGESYRYCQFRSGHAKGFPPLFSPARTSLHFPEALLVSEPVLMRRKNHPA